MHTLDQNTSNVPAFLIKLWKLVEDHDCDDLISWSDKGNSFIIRHAATFARDMLPKYFKHNNLASFIRQLNMYGFRKLANYEKCGLTVESDEMEFHHPFFLRGSEDLLELIKRKMPTTKGIDSNNYPKDFLTDLTSIQDRQETMNNILLGMKKENELLWRELSSLRQKHKAQEQIIQRVIHFLVTIVQSSKQNIGMKRKIAHMLKDSSSSSAKRSRQIVDVVRGSGGNKPDFFFSVPDSDDKATSPEGPVIHEVTELDHEDSIDFGKVTHSFDKSCDQLSDCLDPQVDSPLSTTADVASSDDNFLNAPFLENSLALSRDRSNEEALGLPLDFVTESVDNIDNNVINITIPESADFNLQSVDLLDDAPVISIPETPDKSSNQPTVNSIPETSDKSSKPVVISIPETSDSTTKPTVISIPEISNNAVKKPILTVAQPSKRVVKATPVISIPESSHIISYPEVSVTNDGKIVFGTDVIPFSPSVINLIQDNNNTVVSKNNATQNSPKVVQTKPNVIGKKPPPIVIKTENNAKATKVAPNQTSLPKKTRSLKNQENTAQNNLQLELSDPNTAADTTLAKTALSNHILDVDEQLDWLHDELTNSHLNFDSNMLLGLFSSDDSINNAVQSSQLNSDDIGPIKDPDNNIIGNELVQYTPSLDIDEFLYDNLDGVNFLGEDMDVNYILPDEDPETHSTKSLKTPPIIKQEKDLDLPYSNSCKLSQLASPKGKKNLRGRGRRKFK